MPILGLNNEFCGWGRGWRWRWRSCGTVQLAAGKHDAFVNFFENEGYAACDVTWSGPDTNNAEVPSPFPATTLPS